MSRFLSEYKLCVSEKLDAFQTIQTFSFLFYSYVPLFIHLPSSPASVFQSYLTLSISSSLFPFLSISYFTFYSYFFFYPPFLHPLLMYFNPSFFPSSLHPFLILLPIPTFSSIHLPSFLPSVLQSYLHPFIHLLSSSYHPFLPSFSILR